MTIQTADDAAIVVFDAIHQEGWNDALAFVLAEVVREAVRAAPFERRCTIAKLLDGSGSPLAAAVHGWRSGEAGSCGASAT